jgi:carbon-monoxide dehydrogenase medium subunit
VTAVEFARPGTLEEAIDLLTEHGDEAHLLAGGTAVVLLLKQGLIDPRVLVHLGRLPVSDPRLDTARREDGHLAIGALQPLHRLETDPLIIEAVPAVAGAVARVATVRIRNQATIGGNLVHADPAQDPPPILLVHDTSLDLVGPRGTRVVPLADFFVDVFETCIEPDEVLTTVRVPVPDPASRFGYTKFLPRTVEDYATVSIAARLDRAPDGTIADARIALGNAGPTPFRALDAEASLRGQRPTPATLRLAAALTEQAADPVDDVRGSAGYKRQMVGVWTARTLLDLAVGWEDA